MTWLKLACANLRATPLTSAVNVLLLAFGVASIVLLLLISEQISTTLTRDARGIDLVIGAKGSPVQLVLSSVYHADIPTGNIAQHEADRWALDSRVALAVPIALGDSYRGFRIVGTTPDYPALYSAQLLKGRYWQQPMEVVAGAAVAREAGLALGGHFASAHGLVTGAHQHSDHPYRIVGVLKPTGTVLDRLILTSLDSVWELHAEHEPQDESHQQAAHEADGHHSSDDPREITALLLRYSTPLAALSLPRQVNADSNLQAAAPAFEVTRLLNLVGLGLEGLRAFGGVLILTAGFSVFAALYGALKARRYDLAMLRCLGATKYELFLTLLLEGLMLTIFGSVLGILIGHGVMELLGLWLSANRGISATGWVWIDAEWMLLGGMQVLGVFAAGIPAWQAYRVDVARTLAS